MSAEKDLVAEFEFPRSNMAGWNSNAMETQRQRFKRLMRSLEATGKVHMDHLLAIREKMNASDLTAGKIADMNTALLGLLTKFAEARKLRRSLKSSINRTYFDKCPRRV